MSKERKIENLKNKKLLILIIVIILIGIIVGSILIRNVIVNKRAEEEKYKLGENTSSSLIAKYIRKGVKIGGITGELEVLDTSDATAKAEDIEWGKTGYVNGEKIVGTMLTSNKVSYLKDKDAYFEEDKEVVDDLGNKITLPKGFKVSEETADLVEDGVVIEDKKGNQFVWIPAKTGTGATIHTSIGDKTIIYQRTAFMGENITTDYTEPLDTEEESSVNANGGYYIGRFEAGDKVSTEAKKMRENGDSQSNEVSIKKGQAPYNYISYDNLKSLAEGMNAAQNYTTATTKLVGSYAWDTAINFIQIKTPDYGITSPQGNYRETEFYYANIGETEKNETKASGNAILVPTGQTTQVSNIYDMGGNLYEYTAESSSQHDSTFSYPHSSRGGGYGSYYINSKDFKTAGKRDSERGNAYVNFGYRVALYCS